MCVYMYVCVHVCMYMCVCVPSCLVCIARSVHSMCAYTCDLVIALLLTYQHTHTTTTAE
jgi:hypothetical protein